MRQITKIIVMIMAVAVVITMFPGVGSTVFTSKIC